MTSEAGRSASFQPYYDGTQYRGDTWTELKHLSAQRARLEKAGHDTSALQQRIRGHFDVLERIEQYFAFPGRRVCRQLRRLMERGLYLVQARQTERVVRFLIGDLYRKRDVGEILNEDFEAGEVSGDGLDSLGATGAKPYFEVLVVDEGGPGQGQEVRRAMLAMRRPDDQFVYDVVTVGSLEDAIIAVLFNENIQAVVLRYGYPVGSTIEIPIVRAYLGLTDLAAIHERVEVASPSLVLGPILKQLRPELDLFLVTDEPVRAVAGLTGREFRRVFYDHEDYLELHLSIVRGIHDRYDTPFFSALREYSKRPTGVFHAMPISRGKSIARSHWIRDMGAFYGDNIFLAETSATGGGLDSLLAPTGPIKRAQEKAARAFGAHRTFFVTNGTSTANKIVVQALLAPGDIALVSRDCHKSHHYAMVLAGAQPVYMDPYPLTPYTMYGAVPLREIKRQLVALRDAGKLDRVKMLLLTNCTFDGVVYDPERVMMECLAIKPDLVFVWDEAWFAFARFSPTYRRRTAMAAAEMVRARLADPAYRDDWAVWHADFEARAKAQPSLWLDEPLRPDPAATVVRVYATQSTHKTLTSFRQGSMIHVADREFGRLVHEAFEEAYMTHTSTSPNYQIVASLDIGRRQVELEGYELVEQSVALAMTVRERIEESAALRPYFQVLKAKDLIPAEYRASGLTEFYNPESGYAAMADAWRRDEFVLDPTRITVHVGLSGMDGDTMRRHLMDRYDIQINKTSRNSLLFMLNIGTTRGAVAYLLEVLTKLARELDERRADDSGAEGRLLADRIRSLTEDVPPLPDFSRFHPRFASSTTPEGDLRAAFFVGRSDAAVEFLKLDGSIQAALASGREVVAAGFVTPYPPGFPILVPGQVLSQDILDYLHKLDVKEIHGYNPEFGLRVFRDEVIASTPRRAAAGSPTLGAQA